jgi:hypothetical protein
MIVATMIEAMIMPRLATGADVVAMLTMDFRKTAGRQPRSLNFTAGGRAQGLAGAEGSSHRQ